MNKTDTRYELRQDDGTVIGEYNGLEYARERAKECVQVGRLVRVVKIEITHEIVTTYTAELKEVETE